MSEFEAFKERVGVLPRWVQLAFSTACLERLLPAFEHQTGESWGVPHNMVAMAWSAIDGEPICKIRWTRIGGMLSRIRTDKWNVYASNSIATTGGILADMFAYPKMTKKERARLVTAIFYKGTEILQTLHREVQNQDASVTFAVSPDNGAAWRLAALTQLEESGEKNPKRDFFTDIEVPEKQTGRGLDGSQAGWFPWERVASVPGPDLTHFEAVYSDRAGEEGYEILVVSNDVKSRKQVLGQLAIFFRIRRKRRGYIRAIPCSRSGALSLGALSHLPFNCRRVLDA